MSDFDKVCSAINRATNERRELTDAEARCAAAQFYGGMGPGYAFVSTGTVDPVETWRDLFPRDEYLRLESASKIVADWLGTYFVSVGRRGPVEGWSNLWI